MQPLTPYYGTFTEFPSLRQKVKSFPDKTEAQKE